MATVVAGGVIASLVPGRPGSGSTLETL